MNYTDQIKNDMYVAMKSGDKIKTNILRTLLSALKEKQIEKKEDIIEEQRYTFRSNWTVFIALIIGMVLIVMLMFPLSFIVYGILGLSFGEEFLLDLKGDTS